MVVGVRKPARRAFWIASVQLQHAGKYSGLLLKILKRLVWSCGSAEAPFASIWIHAWRVPDAALSNHHITGGSSMKP